MHIEETAMVSALLLFALLVVAVWDVACTMRRITDTLEKGGK